MIDVASQTIFFVARTKEGDQFVQRLHALDIATGLSKPGSPVIIRARFPRRGKDSADGKLKFDPRIHNQRAALLLSHGLVYVAWAAHCELGAVSRMAARL